MIWSIVTVAVLVALVATAHGSAMPHSLDRTSLIEEMIARPHVKSSGRLSADELLMEHEVVICVRQKNMEMLEHHVLHMSNPASARYQKWWTPQQVDALMG